jgi:hypothetical protein
MFRWAQQDDRDMDIDISSFHWVFQHTAELVRNEPNGSLGVDAGNGPLYC